MLRSARRWERIREIRRVVTGALELERREKRIGASLQAAPTVYLDEDDRRRWRGWTLAELAITSDIVLATEPPPDGAFTLDDVAGVSVVPGLGVGREVRALLAGPARGHGLGGASLPALHRSRCCPACGVSRCAL